MASMAVLAKTKPQPGLWLEKADIPSIGPHEVLIKINKTAVCGTDLHIYKWDQWAQDTIPIPLTIGHEYVGTIVDKGNEVKELAIGDVVSGEGHITCGYCRNCRAGRRHLCPNTVGVGIHRPGAFAQYLALPAFNVFKPTQPLSKELLAIFDPFGNAVHTALSFDLTGEDVLITGAGPIGLMAAAVCRHVGARHIMITDINPYRLDLAKQFNITEAVDVSDCHDDEQLDNKLNNVMARHRMTEGFDVGLEVSGHPQAINGMITAMNSGGRMACLGVASSEVTINWDKLIFHGLNLKGIYGREMFETWYKMAALLESGLDISPVITHHFHYTEFEQAFETMLQGQCGKVILNWDEQT